MSGILMSPKYGEFNQLLRDNRELFFSVYRDRSKVTGAISVKVCWKSWEPDSKFRRVELDANLSLLCDKISVTKRKRPYSPGPYEVKRYIFYPATPPVAKIKAKERQVEVFDIFSTTKRSIRLE